MNIKDVITDTDKRIFKDIDRDTTHNLKKQFLIIGLVPTNEIVVFENKDDFTRLITKFKV